MAEDRKFDGVSFGKQTARECVMYLRLMDMKTTKSLLGKYKASNTDLPVPVLTDGTLTVTATIRGDDGKPVNYSWVKAFQGKVSKAKIKPEGDQVELTMTKAENKEWLRSFVEYLLEL